MIMSYLLNLFATLACLIAVLYACQHNYPSFVGCWGVGILLFVYAIWAEKRT